MANRIDDNFLYSGGYLDANTQVSSISELIEKGNGTTMFLGMSVHMPDAFNSTQGVPYPIDFWITPNGDDIKWEIKNAPSLESEDDFGNFKTFISEFYGEAGYYPLAEGTEILVDGVRYSFALGEDGEPQWTNVQDSLDSTVSDAVDLAVDKITSGASEAFDTLKEVEDWINSHSAGTGTDYGEEIQALSGMAHTHLNKDELDKIQEGDVEKWNSSEADAVASAKSYTDAVASMAKDEIYASAKTYTDEAIAGIEIPTAVTEDIQAISGSVSAVMSSVTVVSGLVENVVSSVTEVSGVVNTVISGLSVISGAVNTITSNITAVSGIVESVSGIVGAISAVSHTHQNKDELDKIQEGDVEKWNKAEENVISAITLNGSALTISDKVVDINLDSYATKTFVTEQIVSAMTGGEVELTGYAKEDWVKGEDANAVESARTFAEAAYESAKTYADSIAIESEPYTGDTAIDVIDNGISVKVSDDEQNFLAVNEENELEVSGVTTDATVTSKEIVIEGGEWADEVKKVYPDGTVPAGTTLQSFLENMLCVEKFVDSVSQSTAFTVTCGTLNPSLNHTGTVEVGTQITLGEITANETSVSQSLSVRTFTYGYKLGEGGEYNSSTAYTETLTPSRTAESKALRVTFSGLVDAPNGGSPVTEKTGDTIITATTLYASEGANSLTMYQTGDTYDASTSVTAGTIYIATNLKNYYKSDKSTPNTFVPSFPATSKQATSNRTISVTGANKYFIGDITEYSVDYWDTDRSNEVRGLSHQAWATASTIANVSYTFKIGTKQQTVVVPARYNSVAGKDANNGDVAFNLTKTFDFTNAQGHVESYKVFVAPALDGLGVDSTISITIRQ